MVVHAVLVDGQGVFPGGAPTALHQAQAGQCLGERPQGGVGQGGPRCSLACVPERFPSAVECLHGT